MRRLTLAVALCLTLVLTVDRPAWAGEEIPCAPEPTDMSIAYGQTIQCSLEVAGDSDLYRFQGMAGEVVRIDATSSAAPCIELRAPDATTVVHCPNATAAVIDTALNQTGTYTIIARSTFNVTGPYLLVLERLLPASGSAASIDYGQTVTGTLDPAGDTDLFTFTGTAGTVVRIDATSSAAPCIQLIAPNNGRMTHCPNATAALIDVVLTQTGTFTLLVRSTFNVAGTYVLALERLLPASNNAQPIDYGQDATGSLDPAGDTDLFTFTGTAGTVVRIDATSSAAPCIQLVTPSNARTTHCPNATAAFVDVVLSQTGPHTILVRSTFNVTGQYLLALERLLPPSANAQRINYAQTLSSNLSPGGETDLFFFNGWAGSTIRIDAASSAAPCLVLVRPDNTRALHCPNATAARIDAVLTQTGTHTIIVRSTFNVAGNYNLTLQCLVGPCAPDPCTPSILPPSVTITGTLHLGAVSLTMPAGCAWLAEALTAGVTITEGTSGIGNGTVKYFVGPNPTGAPRTLLVRIAGLIFTITQLASVRGQAALGDFNGDGRSDPTVFRPGSGVWYTNFGDGTSSDIQWGLPADIPVLGDYDGDARADLAVFRPATGEWFVRWSSTGQIDVVQFGLPGDRPVPGDYDGDGRTDVAVFRPATAEWYLRKSTEGFAIVQFGLLNDLPVPGDYDGDGRTDPAVFRPATSTWFIRTANGQVSSESWGLLHDVPVPADYDGDSRTEMAVFRPWNGTWYVKGRAPVQWGWSSDTPVPSDYDGDGRADFAVYRPSNGTWFITSATGGTWSIQWGLPGDLPAIAQTMADPPARPGDYDGDGVTDLTVYRASQGTWYLRRSAMGLTSIGWGLPGDRPVPGDYDGDGLVDTAVFRPSTAVWYLNMSMKGPATVQFGLLQDIPVPADYDGDGVTDVAVFRPATATWYVKRSALGDMAVTFGEPGDVPLPRDYTGDGAADLAVFRPAGSRWLIKRPLDVLNIQWGVDGDIPLVGDYNGDGLTDFTVFRPGNATWFVRFNDGTAGPFAWTSVQWGLLNDRPLSGDYDGDGRTDVAVFRPSTGVWHVRRSSDGGTVAVQWGLSSDIPLSGGQ